ncbi:MAG: DUF4783 domain-containing protein [Sphingobacteriales bacterium]|nr:MAG: DUF4783 domain-containing protein [Sphingobacteriales bacterium]
MPLYIRTILLAIVFLGVSSFDLTVDEIFGAIRKGDAVKISRHFDSLVEITVAEKSCSYSRTQAELVLRDFFSTHNVRNFTMLHKANSNNADYYVGKLSTARGEFRTTVLVKTRGDKRVVQELRFE